MEGAMVLERDGYPPGVPCWVDTGQPDPKAATLFYGSLFGWEFVDRMPPGTPGEYFAAQLRGRDVAAVGSQTPGTPQQATWNTYIWVDDTDDTASKIKAAGGQALMEPFDIADSGRMGVFSDPSGAAFCVWQANKHKGAQLVNEPGTWNFSDLNTRDPEGAQEFYGAVFGWETEKLNLGFGESYMWKVPGYGDHLASNDPDLRRRHEEQGAPKGFADAIGWLQPMTSDQFGDDVPSHWSVTFSVDDTDRVADLAAKLGGEITITPFDAGVARVAALRDPQGASFTVSKYTPREPG
jgi:predicted enzyme related to lactoylglutathione lyase